MKEEKDIRDSGRRNFLKRLGGSVAAVSSIAMVGCSGDKGIKKYVAEGVGGDVPTDKMTYRTNHNSGDKVFIFIFRLYQYVYGIIETIWR